MTLNETFGNKSLAIFLYVTLSDLKVIPSLKQNIRSNKWQRKEKQQRKKLHLREEKLHLREKKQHLREKKQRKREEDNKFYFINNFLFLSIFFLKKRDLKSQKRGNIPRFFI